MILLVASCVTVQKVVVNKYQEPPSASIADGKGSKPFTITRIVSKMNRGEQFGTVQVGLLCVPKYAITWRGSGKYNISDQEYAQIFLDECKKLNYNIIGDPNSLFDTGDESIALIHVGAMIVDRKINACLPLAGYGSQLSKGEASVSVEWQVYSVLDKKLLHKVTTNGSSEIKDAAPNAADDLQYNAFSQAVRGLLADEKFQRIVRGGKEADASKEAKNADNPPIVINIDKKSSKAIPSFKQAKTAAFTIFIAKGTGSGFFISPDGYGLTNYHVVEKTDKIRCRDESGKVFFATVLNRDAKRDIALFKADESNVPYLDVEMNRLDVGTEVYAVGSPQGDDFHGTVTKGIVSGYRLLNDRLELQSDVGITHGNSGGPLVDARGKVAGISTWKYGDATMLNFFIPIFDGLEKLNVTIQ
jgi:serine protease Do